MNNRRRINEHGAYGVAVNTGACGALNSGSIPDRHPIDVFLKKFHFDLVILNVILHI